MFGFLRGLGNRTVQKITRLAPDSKFAGDSAHENRTPDERHVFFVQPHRKDGMRHLA